MSTFNEFYPQFRYVNNITNALQAVITFTEPHQFTVGEIIGVRCSKPFGMYEINNLRGKVLSLDTLTITVDIDTTTWTPFTYAALNQPGTTPPVCVPSSSGVLPNQEIPQTNIIDAFDNRRT